MAGGDDVVHHAGGRLRNINRRVMPFFCQRARQDNVSIQDRASRIGNRVLLVITFGQHRVKSRDGAAARRAITAALNQLGKARKARRWIAFGGGRLANGQRDFSLRHGITRQGIHQKQNMLALIPEILCDGAGVGGTLQA